MIMLPVMDAAQTPTSQHPLSPDVAGERYSQRPVPKMDVNFMYRQKDIQDLFSHTQTIMQHFIHYSFIHSFMGIGYADDAVRGGRTAMRNGKWPGILHSSKSS